MGDPFFCFGEPTEVRRERERERTTTTTTMSVSMSTSQRVAARTTSSSRPHLAPRKAAGNQRRRCAHSGITKATKDREMWYPGAVPPKYLDGTMLGDYGFDPLRLGQNENLVEYYREAELMNGRWAMVACVGILFTEAAGLPDFVQAATVDYGISYKVLVITEVIVMGFFEYYRSKNYAKTGECSLLLQAPFDPLKLKTEETKLKELKNGRLAMLAFLGFCSQYAVRGKGPIACFKDHIADPTHQTIYTSKVGLEFTVFVVALCVLPMVIEAFKSIGGDSEDEFRPIPW